ncbi:MAG: DUF2784 domain-containing protein [Proteobacteria bacterium]|nr:DUF2784 domain-containing protein [Pseudomonadota bacterium]
MKIIYRAAAQLVLLLHILFSLVAMFGGFGLLIDMSWMWIHLPVLIWAVAVNLFSWTCPLTPLEKRLWRTGGSEEYEGGFLVHYLGPLLNLDSSSRELEVQTGTVLLIWNMLVYVGIWLSMGGH